MKFQLHTKLEKDCIALGRLTLCQVLLMNDCQFPWLILVPEVNDITEIYQLDSVQRTILMEESCFIAERLTNLFKPDKINIAAIGNLVPQLHIHHVVRYRTDIAWPAPIWGKFPASSYSEQELELKINEIKNILGLTT